MVKQYARFEPVATRNRFINVVMANYTKQELRKAELSRFIASGLPLELSAPICGCAAR